jgi:Protein of unknown function (DUF1573)
MNTTFKTVLLTILTLSFFAIALVELSGISQTAFLNKYKGETITSTASVEDKLTPEEVVKRDEDVKKMRKTTMEVANAHYSFGKLKDGDKVRHTWVVKNTGTSPLMISNINTSCGCTAPYFSKQLIMPGREDEITLTFNSAGKSGHVTKNAHIMANTENSPFPISFDADVEPK